MAFERRDRELTRQQEDRRYALFVPHIRTYKFDGVLHFGVGARIGVGEYQWLTDATPLEETAKKQLRNIRQQMFEIWKTADSELTR